MSVKLDRLARYNKKQQEKKNLIIKNVLGYIRVSTDTQEDNTSLSTQKEAIENYCRAKNYQLLSTYADVASGSNFEREEFSKMLHFVENADVDAIILYKLDRLSRSVVDGYSFIQKLEEKNISIVSINENIDNSTPTGQAMLQLIFTFAEMERKVIRDRMHSGRLAKLKKGDKPAGAVFGYHYNERKKLYAVSSEVDAIKRIFDYYDNNHSLARVKYLLDFNGITNRKNNYFSRQAIHYILTNIFYIGYIIYDGTLIEGNHEVIIDNNYFQKIQAILSANCKNSR